MSSAGERVGRNEAVFREVNERIRELSEQFQVAEPSGLVEFVCECSADRCHEMLSLTLPEYQHVRSSDNRFVTVPEHIWHPEFEREIERTERYWIVEKWGEAEEAAAEYEEQAS
jgi:hypothetical protein